MRINRVKDKQAIANWNDFSRAFSRSAAIDIYESEADRKKRIAHLEKEFFRWAKYYFPNVTKGEFAPWHKKYSDYVIANKEAYAAIKVCRDMAKSSLTAMLILYLYYKGEVQSLGMFSHIQTQAEGLLNAIKIAFEKNERLINDYGSQVSFGSWTSNKFTTITGASFRAIGAGQNPRGEKNEDSIRFDTLVFDDFDDPEVCRNPERLDQHWKYVEGDCIPAMHVTGTKRILFLNNQIDEDCIIERAYQKAKVIENSLTITVNLLDKDGKSNWPGYYSDEACKKMIALAGGEAETEYFNQPSRKGRVFKKEWFVFKKLPPLNKYKFLVAYHDGGFKKTKNSDTKALVLIGLWEREFHIRKVYVDNVSIPEAIAWHYDLFALLKKANATAAFYMEEVFLLSLLYDHFDRESVKYGFKIPIRGDKRAKPDKDLRIAATAGHYERGQVVFDEAIKDDRHTQELINQYLKFTVGVKTKKDGPDAVEGGFNILREMVAFSTDFTLIPVHTSKHKI